MSEAAVAGVAGEGLQELSSGLQGEARGELQGVAAGRGLLVGWGAPEGLAKRTSRATGTPPDKDGLGVIMRTLEKSPIVGSIISSPPIHEPWATTCQREDICMVKERRRNDLSYAVWHWPEEPGGTRVGQQVRRAKTSLLMRVRNLDSISDAAYAVGSARRPPSGCLRAAGPTPLLRFGRPWNIRKVRATAVDLC